MSKTSLALHNFRGFAILNVLAPEGGTVLRRSLIGYGVAALYVAAGLVAIRLAA